ncbi:hypothetical protein SATRM34S_04839 [Streptomyces atroolivaceus]
MAGDEAPGSGARPLDGESHDHVRALGGGPLAAVLTY